MAEKSCPFNKSRTCNAECPLFMIDCGMCAIKSASHALMYIFMEIKSMPDGMRVATEKSENIDNEPQMVDAINYPVDLP